VEGVKVLAQVRRIVLVQALKGRAFKARRRAG